ncbi:MAG: hypothetical protein VX100_19990 [Pseudomonadota bacterium]|nr:hypothetical protein [Pseudomonadota bacterium]
MTTNKDLAVAFMHNNLNQLTGFHNHVHGFFNDNLKESQLSEEINQHQKNFLKREYEVNLPNQLRKSVFLMMFGHLEECLHLSWLASGEPIQLNKSEFGIAKYKPFVRDHLGFNLGSDSDWAYIQECQLIRNAIIHAAGRVSLLKKPHEVESLLKQRSDYFEIEHDRVYLTNTGISAFQKSIARFTERVERAI